MTAKGLLCRPSAIAMIAGLIGLLTVVPIMVVVPMSFNTSPAFEFPPSGFWLGYYRAYFDSRSWLAATANSLLVAAATALLAMALVTPAAFVMVRRNFRGKAIAKAMLMVPMVVPSIVMAIGYYIFFAGIGLNQTYSGLILAHTAGAIPVAFLVTSAFLKGFDRSLERAAANCGASPLRVFLHITLPVLRPGFLAAGLFSFVHSFDEAVIALFISGRDVETLPRKMFSSITNEADPVIAVVSTLLVSAVVTGGFIALAARWNLGRGHSQPAGERA